MKKLIIITWTAVCLILPQGDFVSAAQGAAKQPVSVAPDVSEISQVRKMLRAACAKIKKSNAKPEDAESLLSDAESVTGRALAQWRSFSNAHMDAPPLIYSRHPDWNAAVEAIEKSILTMEQAAKKRDAKTALTRCGATCRKFVEINEKAGVEMTTDILFRFRKAAKPLMKDIRDKNIAEIALAVPTLLSLKEEAVSRFAGDLRPTKGRGDALIKFSNAVEAFADSVSKAEENNLKSRYRKMMTRLEAAYDNYL